MVSLTGSSRAGRQVAVAAAERLIRAHLELGGNAPVIVFADVDPAATAKAITGAAYSTPDRTAPRPPGCW